MAFWKRKHWDEEFDENYGDRALRERPLSQPRRIWPHLLALLLLGVLFVGLAGIMGGQSAFEKTITALLLPVGLVWIVLMILIYFALVYRHTAAAILGIIAWTVLTIAGNGWVANQLAHLREAPFLDFDEETLEPLDVVFLLGGGTSTRENGSVQLGQSGDRVMVAARLYHLGKTKTIVCTGSQTKRTTRADLHPREEAAQLLESLGIDKVAIEQLAGDNTSEEAEKMKAYLDQHPEFKRVGVLTSAWHLPRALRLLEQLGIDAIPIPADFKSGYFIPAPEELIPSPTNLRTNQLLVKEWLADLLQR